MNKETEDTKNNLENRTISDDELEQASGGAVSPLSNTSLAPEISDAVTPMKKHTCPKCGGTVYIIGVKGSCNKCGTCYVYYHNKLLEFK